VKRECANHSCYKGSIEKLVAENTSYKGKGGLTLKMRKCLIYEFGVPETMLQKPLSISDVDQLDLPTISNSDSGHGGLAVF
jgi:hypothetical protein